ncbi:MAG: hypothetical protein COB81_05680 [Flavobacteriaceae bacterium]|nr:MAG: hypothetical protein COB81_05680 [Flavobacteriaceae bacterium]
MKTKRSNLTLYILKFKYLSIIKIGTSKSLCIRINTFRKDYKEEFDLQHSYAIGCHNAAKIKALEYELLTNTVEFKIIGKLLEQFEGLNGATEIRMDICLPLILKLIKYKAKLTGEFHIYSSISLEKNIHSELPTSIFNELGETPYKQINIAESLIKAIKRNTEEFKELDYEEITNKILASYLKTKKIKLEKNLNSAYKRKKGMHFPRFYKTNTWYWMNPSSKLNTIKEKD